MSFTVANQSNRALILSVQAGSTPSAVTYAGVSMTLVDSRALTAGSQTLFVYKLAAPTTGANNISVTATSITVITAASYYNVSQSSLVEASAKADSSTSLTTVSQRAFVHLFYGEYNSSGTTNSGTSSVSSKYVSGTATGTIVNAL